MNTFHVWTDWPQPKLSLWRDRSPGDNSQLQYDALDRGTGPHGLRRFEALLDDQLHPPAHAKVYRDKEWEENTKTFPRTSRYRFRKNYWFAHGAARVLTSDPFAAAHPRVTIHLITAQRFRDGNVYVWTPGGRKRELTNGVPEPTGRRFVVDLEGVEQHLFLFKFFKPASGDKPAEWEPEYANKLWSSTDGAEIWVHSRANAISTALPAMRTLRIRTRQQEQPSQPVLHLWQEDSDFKQDVPGAPQVDGWIAYDVALFTERTYRFLLFHAGHGGTLGRSGGESECVSPWRG